MAIDQYQGDPKVFITNDGAEMVFIGGQPLMDGGIENAILISLFTLPGWSGNIFTRRIAEQIGSTFQQVGQGTFTLSTLNTLQNLAEQALQWMIDDNIVSDIRVNATNPTGRIIRVTIDVFAPDLQVLLTRQGTNWIIQIQNPAHEKV